MTSLLPRAYPSASRGPWNKHPSRAILLLLCLPAALLVGGCGLKDQVTHVKTETYEMRSEAPTQGDLALKLPDLVPADATAITVKVQTQADGRMYSWTSPSGQLPQDCKSGDATDVRPFAPDAWPKGTYTATALTCGPLPVHVRRDGQTFYAWW